MTVEKEEEEVVAVAAVAVVEEEVEVSREVQDCRMQRRQLWLNRHGC